MLRRSTFLAVASLGLAAGACGDSPSDVIDADPADAALGPGDADDPADAAADAGSLAGGVSTLAGAGESGIQDGNNARFDNPVNVAVDPDSGDVIVADYGNNRIRRVTPEGFTTTVVTGQEGEFEGPFGLAFYAGALYAHTEEGGAGALWEVNLENGGASQIATPGDAAGLGSHPDEGLIVPDRAEHTIALFDPGTQSLTPLAGSAGEAGYIDDTGEEARFDEPYAAVALPGGDILVADAGNHVIRRVTLGGEVTTFAGTGEAGTADGPVDEARFNRPQGLAIDDDGTVYVSDVEGHVVRAIADGVVTTIAGSGTAGFSDSATDTLSARFFGLEGIDAGPGAGLIYAADGNRDTGEDFHRIRRIEID